MFSDGTPVISFCIFPLELYFCHTDELSDIRKQFTSPNPRIVLFSQRVLFREGRPRDLAQPLLLATSIGLGERNIAVDCTTAGVLQTIVRCVSLRSKQSKHNCCLEEAVLYSLI